MGFWVGVNSKNPSKSGLFDQKVGVYSRKTPKTGLFNYLGLYSRVGLQSSGYGITENNYSLYIKYYRVTNIMFIEISNQEIFYSMINSILLFVILVYFMILIYQLIEQAHNFKEPVPMLQLKFFRVQITFLRQNGMYFHLE